MLGGMPQLGDDAHRNAARRNAAHRKPHSFGALPTTAGIGSIFSEIFGANQIRLERNFFQVFGADQKGKKVTATYLTFGLWLLCADV